MVVYDPDEQMYRVQGVLAVSRAFGNAYFKPFVTHVPEIHEQVLAEDNLFLCIASDGLWECVQNEEVGPILLKHGIHAGSDVLAQLSFARGGLDNITVMCVDLREGRIQDTDNKQVNLVDDDDDEEEVKQAEEDQEQVGR
jgi:protein phosphatase 1L